MPEELLQRLIAARNFNQGFATVEYVACAHGRSRFPFAAAPRTTIDAAAFETRSARTHRHAGRDRDAPSPAAFRPRLLRRRLCGGLLQLHVVGSARRRRVRGLRGDRRHFRSGHGEAAARHDLCGRRPAGSGRGLQGLPRPAAERRTRCCASAASPTLRWQPEHDRSAQRRPSPRRRLRAASRPPSKPAARSSPKAATPSKPWWRWRRRSPRSIRI